MSFITTLHRWAGRTARALGFKTGGKLHGVYMKIMRWQPPFHIPVYGMWLHSMPLKNMVSGYHEIDLTRFLEKKLKPGMTFVDLGAAVGYFSALADRLIGPTGDLIAVEPFYEQYRALWSNVPGAGKSEHRTLVLGAVGDVNGTTKIAYADSMGKASLRSLYADEKDIPPHIRQVPLLTVDTLLKGSNITQLDIMKIDVEGAEPLVLAGMRQTLAQWPECIVVLELSESCVGRQDKSVQTQLDEYKKYFTHISYLDKAGEEVPIETLDVEQLVRTNKHINLACHGALTQRTS